jgi:hypothetical protein
MTTIEEILAEFDEKFKKSDGWNPSSIGSALESEIKSFISSTHSHLIEEIIKEIENFDIHYGIHGEPVENPLMHTKDFKRLLIINLSTLIEKKDE